MRELYSVCVCVCLPTFLCQTVWLQNGHPTISPPRFTLETESSSLQSNDDVDDDPKAEEDITQEEEEEEENKENASAEEVFGEEEKDSIKPPKIWISKSASMEHDLDWESPLFFAQTYFLFFARKD